MARKIPTPREIVEAKPEDMATQEDYIKARAEVSQKIRADVITALQNTDISQLIARHIDQLKREITEVTNAMIGIDTRWSQISLDENGLLSQIAKGEIRDQIEKEYVPIIGPMVNAQIEKYVNSTTFHKHLKHCIQESFERAIYGYDGISKMVQTRVAEEASKLMDEIIK